MIVLRLPFIPVRVAWFGTKVGYRTGRLLGWRRLFLVAVGIGIGLLVAPVPGRELRERLREKLEAAREVYDETGIVAVPIATPDGDSEVADVVAAPGTPARP